jgi:hypothetical protein
MYESLAGRHPWPGRQTVGELIIAICTEPFTHLQDAAPWVPPGLVEIVHQAMRRKPEDRFQTMKDFGQALQPYTGGEAKLEVEDLSRLSEQVRAVVAPRASSPSLPPRVGVSSVDASSMSQQIPELADHRKSNRFAVVAAAAAVALGAIGAVLLFGDSSETTGESLAPTTAVERTTAEHASPTPLTVSVTIKPKTATVTVAGKEVALDDGVLSLEAEAGESFAVIVNDGDRKLERTVVVTRDGRAEPNLLELAPAEPDKTASPKAVRRPPTGGKRPPPKAPAQPRPTAPKPPPTSGPFSPVDKW